MLNFFRGKSRLFLLVAIDLIIMSVAYWAILYRVRFTNDSLATVDLSIYYYAMIGCVFFARLLFQVYRQMWRYASSDVFLRMVLSDVVGGLLYVLADRTFFRYHLSFAHAVATISVGLLASLSARFVYQFLRKRPDLPFFYRFRKVKETAPKTNIAIVGAGELGVMLAKELLFNPNSRYFPVYFIDNDQRKIGTLIEGIKVIGPDSEVIKHIKDLAIQEIILTVPKMEPEVREQVINTYMSSGYKVLVYDYPTDRIDHEEKRTIRDIDIEDLLFREPITLNDPGTAEYYQGKTIMVTGAGGSIGSELTRQLAKMKPERLILLDVYENGVYDLGQELGRAYGDALTFDTIIASVCNKEQMRRVFGQHRPQVVFHAAAHKHVPLMEANCAEAIYNNVFGTLNTVNAAEEFGAERFVLISTDKAVNPTNIMGATKRMCEMIVQSRRDSKTNFVAVRFGNVLGSNGSVVPLFKQQIENGGPVTITDKRIIRYFMTIPEAAQLVLKTGRRAERSEIYVLDMGKPIKIYDLATKLISLSGLVPDKDIMIEEIGLRPGEKLYEELLTSSEGCEQTEEDRIFIERSPIVSRTEVGAKLDRLFAALPMLTNGQEFRQLMREVVPTYAEAEEINSHAEFLTHHENGITVNTAQFDGMGVFD